MNGPGRCSASLKYAPAFLEEKIDDKFSLTNLCWGKKCLKFNYPQKKYSQANFPEPFLFFLSCVHVSLVSTAALPSVCQVWQQTIVGSHTFMKICSALWIIITNCFRSYSGLFCSQKHIVTSHAQTHSGSPVRRRRPAFNYGG